MGDQMDLTTPLFTFVLAGTGAYLGSYLKKKGENLATHEDIDKVVKQVEAVTKATKQIESKISNEMWDRQKRWEVTRDSLLELVRALSEFMEAMSNLDSAFQAEKGIKEGNPDMVSSFMSEALDRWARAGAAFSGASLLAETVCGNEVKATLNALNLYLQRIAGRVLAGELGAFTRELVQSLALRGALLTAIRGELGILDPALLDPLNRR
jgi:hypothetical protein